MVHCMQKKKKNTLMGEPIGLNAAEGICVSSGLMNSSVHSFTDRFCLFWKWSSSPMIPKLWVQDPPGGHDPIFGVSQN